MRTDLSPDVCVQRLTWIYDDNPFSKFWPWERIGTTAEVTGSHLFVYTGGPLSVLFGTPSIFEGIIQPDAQSGGTVIKGEFSYRSDGLHRKRGAAAVLAFIAVSYGACGLYVGGNYDVSHCARALFSTIKVGLVCAAVFSPMLGADRMLMSRWIAKKVKATSVVRT